MNRRSFLCAALTGPLAARTCWGEAAQVSFRREPGRIDVFIGGKPLTSFHYGSQWDKPFLHPLRTAAGIVVTRGFPIEKIEGESNDHPWHRGIISGHGDINGTDFWRELGREKTGRLIPRAEPQAGDSSISVELDLVRPDGKSIGGWRERFVFSRSGADNIIDAYITALADRGTSLKMGDTEDGGFGLRFADAFRQDRGATLMNSDGLVTTEKIWGKRARWVEYSTSLGGRLVGVAMMDHPSNPKHPTYWHARGYGLCAANPFGEHDFLRDKNRDGSVTVPEGGNLKFHYRVLIHPDGAREARIEEKYAAFARISS